MDLFEKLQQGLNKGIEASRQAFQLAKNKAQELGEKGVLKLEILQLEDRLVKLHAQLGIRAYEALSANVTLTPTSPVIAESMKEIAEVVDLLTEKKNQLDASEGT